MPPATDSSPPPFIHAIGGSIGGALATLAFYPLEIIRVEMQKSQAQPNNNNITDGNSGSASAISSNKEDNPQENGQSNSASSDQPETNLECFIRLYKKQALYRGASAMVTTMIISSFITFYALEVARRSLTRLQQNGSSQQQRNQLRGKQQQIRRLHNHMKFLAYILPKSKIGTSLLASSLAGVINVFLTTPLWVATRRIMESSSEEPLLHPEVSNHQHPEKQFQVKRGPQKQPSLWNVMHQISCNEGVLQLWQGTWSSLLLVSNPAIQYFLYEQIRALMLSRRNNVNRRGNSHGRIPSRGGGDSVTPSATLTAMEALVFGAMAKTVSTVITYPLQLAQVLIRLRSNEVKSSSNESLSTTSEPTTEQHNKVDDPNMKEFSGIIDCLHQQFTNGGFYSLFHGMNSKLLQNVLTAAFTFLTYEETLGIVGKVYQTSFAT